ncbi:MAG: hypothetical protein EWV82_03225 [Microcystis aeruginosa Ma_AC_P_19900807_S299]|jgi:phage anti-repressor protein|nr:MAG: hypothetical protein EWV82_03225 [Microcystis aeruginosa Ma_AC_P_19900807_S299]
MTNLTKALKIQIQTLAESPSEYPVHFDVAWNWIGYSRKDNAKKVLVANFEENYDFQVFLNNKENPLGGRPTEDIYLTVDCFKQLAMMAGTQKGKEVRKYFLECERHVKLLLSQEKNQKLRASTKFTRRTFTDAVSDYITRHNLSKTNKGKWLYKNATDRLYKLLFGHNAQKLKQILGATNPRDAMSLIDLRDVECVENLAVRLIDGRNMEPMKAVEAAFNLQLLQTRELEIHYLESEAA